MSNDPRIRGWKSGQPLHVKSPDACKWCEGAGAIIIDEDDGHEAGFWVKCAKCDGKGFTDGSR